jgi:thioredoxin-related protein
MNIKTLLATLTCSVSAVASLAMGAEAWTTDFEAAKKTATEQKKDLLLSFTGSDWCGPCMMLDEEVFAKEEFHKGTKDAYVLVNLDFPQKKKLEAAVKEQNEKLSETYGIEGFPTVVMCDASAKPYATTGYQPGGAAAYLDHLKELQAVRVKRDEAFDLAEKATSDTEKAKALVAGLGAMEPEIVEAHYADVLAQIEKLDPEDKSGFVKARKEAVAKKAAEEAAMQKVQQFFVGQLQPLMKAKDYAKANELVKGYIKDNPDLSEDVKIGLSLNIAMAGPMEKGDLKEAHRLVEEMAKQYPKSELAENLDEVKDAISEQIGQAGGQQAPAPETQEAPKEGEKAEKKLD